MKSLGRLTAIASINPGAVSSSAIAGPIKPFRLAALALTAER